MKRYFVYYEGKKVSGSCEVNLTRKIKNYEDIRKVAEIIKEKEAEGHDLIIKFYREF